MYKFLSVLMLSTFIVGTAHAEISLLSKDATEKKIATKQNTLSTDTGSGNIKIQGEGTVLSSVTAANGTVTFSKSNVMIPSGGQDAKAYAPIWIE